jgi:2-polyprenyl-6-methoxyphenol hydroxylase-like FAD-dependent oxidoreductase
MKTRLSFENNKTKEKKSVKSDVIFGADGAYSEVRYEMQRTPNFNINQHHEPYGYKELHFPPTADGTTCARQKRLAYLAAKKFYDYSFAQFRW